MLQDVRQLIARNRATLVREAAGLAGVCVTIVIALYLPVLACQQCRSPVRCPVCQGPVRLRRRSGGRQLDCT